MCSLCEDLQERINRGSPSEYRELARKLAAREKQGAIKVASGACCSLDEVVDCVVWPSDVIVHELICCGCGDRFSLTADTYHGGVRWSGAIPSRETNV
jgi:hypothetical protein